MYCMDNWLMDPNGKLHEYKYLNLNNARTCVNNYRRLAERNYKKNSKHKTIYFALVHRRAAESEVFNFLFYFRKGLNENISQ